MTPWMARMRCRMGTRHESLVPVTMPHMDGTVGRDGASDGSLSATFTSSAASSSSSSLRGLDSTLAASA